MPKPAQDRIVRGPFGALLILLGLMLSSGTAAAAGFDLRQSAPRLGSSRSAAAVALLASGVRDPSGEEAPDSAGGAAAPSGPSLVARSLWERPPAEPRRADDAAPADPAKFPYRARAPPAA